MLFSQKQTDKNGKKSGEKYDIIRGWKVVATSQRKNFPLPQLFPVRGGAPRRGDKFIHTEVKDNETAAF